MKYYELSANNNNDMALCLLGHLYEKMYNNKTSPDYLEKAFQCYKKSEENESSYGLFDLGRCFEFGIWVKKDENKAFNYYKKSAEKSNSYA